jgi:hypothetical protein
MRGAMIILVSLSVSATSCEPRWPWPEKDNGALSLRLDMAALAAKNHVDMGTLSPENARFFISYYCQKGSLTSASKLHNLGNAFFLDDKLPEAIFCFQSGLRLDPNDAGLQANLDYARARVQYPFGDHGRPEFLSWPAWLHRPSLLQVFVAALILYAVACLLITRWFMRQRRNLLVRAVVIFILAAAGANFWLYLENENAWREQHPLVVVRDDKHALRKGNGPSYPANPDLPFLSRGMEARRLHERGAWLQIQFASGEIGWVEKAAVLVDDPCR